MQGSFIHRDSDTRITNNITNDINLEYKLNFNIIF
mgnify:CR=1 FL=1